MKKQTYAVGVGRHSNEEVGQMMVHDLEMLSTLLGNVNTYIWRVVLFGDIVVKSNSHQNMKPRNIVSKAGTQ